MRIIRYTFCTKVSEELARTSSDWLGHVERTGGSSCQKTYLEQTTGYRPVSRSRYRRKDGVTKDSGAYVHNIRWYKAEN